jgi:hypothetical protein
MANYLLISLPQAHAKLNQFATLASPHVVDQEYVLSVIVDNFSDHHCKDGCGCTQELFEWISTDPLFNQLEENESEEKEDARLCLLEELQDVLMAVQAEVSHIDPNFTEDTNWSYVKQRGKHDALLVQTARQDKLVHTQA